MMRLFWALGVGILGVWGLAFLGGGAARAATVGELRCEGRDDPLGIDVALPRLSWTIRSQRRGELQTAYHVLVATSGEALARDEGDLWDSGKVASARSYGVAYAGRPLDLADALFLEGPNLGPRRAGLGLERARPLVDGALEPQRLEGRMDRLRRGLSAVAANRPRTIPF